MKTKEEIIASLWALKGDEFAKVSKYNTAYTTELVFSAMEDYAAPYQRIADLISRIYFYGNFVAETPTERELEHLLTKVGLWPTTEDEILKRDK